MRGGPRVFPRDSSCIGVLWILPPPSALRVRGSHPVPPALPKRFHCASCWLLQSAPRGVFAPVWAPPVSLAATPGITVVFSSSGYLDVSVRRVPPARLCVQRAVAEVRSAGFPHSDTHGSQGMCPSPWLFAACRVFRRLPVPRHPSCALLCLTSAAPASVRARRLSVSFRFYCSAIIALFGIPCTPARHPPRMS